MTTAITLLTTSLLHKTSNGERRDDLERAGAGQRRALQNTWCFLRGRWERERVGRTRTAIDLEDGSLLFYDTLHRTWLLIWRIYLSFCPVIFSVYSLFGLCSPPLFHTHPYAYIHCTPFVPHLDGSTYHIHISTSSLAFSTHMY